MAAAGKSPEYSQMAAGCPRLVHEWMWREDREIEREWSDEPTHTHTHTHMDTREHAF